MAMTPTQKDRYSYLTTMQYERVYDENTGDADGYDQEYEDVPLGRHKPESQEEIDLVNVYLGVKEPSTPLELEWHVQLLRDRVKNALISIDFYASDLGDDIRYRDEFVDSHRPIQLHESSDADADVYERSETVDDYEIRVEAEENTKAERDNISAAFGEYESRVCQSTSDLDRAIREREDILNSLGKLALKPEYAACFSDEERVSASPDGRMEISQVSEVKIISLDDDDPFLSIEERGQLFSDLKAQLK